MAEKFTHTDVAYDNPAKNMNHRCGNCSHFIKPSIPPETPSCQIVVKPIHQTGWCRKWHAL